MYEPCSTTSRDKKNCDHCDLYRLAHKTSATHIIDLFNLEGSTIRKYVDIVCDSLCDKNKLFNNYISIPFGDHLQKTYKSFP